MVWNNHIGWKFAMNLINVWYGIRAYWVEKIVKIIKRTPTLIRYSRVSKIWGYISQFESFLILTMCESLRNSTSDNMLLGRYWGIEALRLQLCLLCNFHCIALSGPFFEKWGGVTYSGWTYCRTAIIYITIATGISVPIFIYNPNIFSNGIFI